MADEKVSELIEGAEEDEEGLTNDVYFTDNEVIKVYPKYPLTSLFVSVTTLLSTPEYYTREKRMKSERKAVQVMKDVEEVDAPRIKDSTEDTLVFEKVEGRSGYKYLNECGDKEAYELGESLREFFDYIHSENFALRDAKITNFLVSSASISSIDHEYADLDPNRLIYFVDEFTLISSVRQTENYEKFREGFRPSKKAAFVSFFTSIGHAMLLERSIDRTKKSLKSLKSDL